MIIERPMVDFLIKFLLVVRSRLKSRARLAAENLVLRQQVIVLSRKSGSRVWLRNIDRLIFVWIYRRFPSILDAITVVKPETVIRSASRIAAPATGHRRAYLDTSASLEYRGGTKICFGSYTLARRRQCQNADPAP